MSGSPLQNLVVNRCREVGTGPAAELFGVSQGLIRQWVAGSKTPSLAAVEKVFSMPETAPADAGWKDKEVFVAMPFYKDTNPLTLWSILGVWDRAKFRAGMKYNTAFISHTRNALSADFLGVNVPWSWWVDDDMVSPMGMASWYNQFTGMSLPDQYAGIHTPTRLRSHNKSICSGLYVGRGPAGRAVYAEALAETTEGDAENKWAHGAPYDMVKQTQFAGFGCMLVHRQVFLDIQAKFPHLAPQRGEPFHFFSSAPDALLTAVPELRAKIAAAANEVKGGSAEVALRLLTDATKQIDSASSKTSQMSMLHQSEDRTFCSRATEAGHPTHVDFAVCCGHVGPHVFHHQNTTAK